MVDHEIGCALRLERKATSTSSTRLVNFARLPKLGKRVGVAWIRISTPRGELVWWFFYVFNLPRATVSFELPPAVVLAAPFGCEMRRRGKHNVGKNIIYKLTATRSKLTRISRKPKEAMWCESSVVRLVHIYGNYHRQEDRKHRWGKPHTTRWPRLESKALSARWLRNEKEIKTMILVLQKRRDESRIYLTTAAAKYQHWKPGEGAFHTFRPVRGNRREWPLSCLIRHQPVTRQHRFLLYHTHPQYHESLRATMSWEEALWARQFVRDMFLSSTKHSSSAGQKVGTPTATDRERERIPLQ